MSQFTWAIKSKRHQGTYKVVPKVDWMALLEKDFGHPNWAVLYPLNAKGQAVGILTPRMACKLFHDAVYIIKKGEESPKFVQDRIPDIAYKCYKKKQWRKQFFEAMRRVVCRLALGKGFRPNCVAEDVFIHAILNMSFELGWRRIEAFIDVLPESDQDKDLTRVTRLGANDEVGSLLKSTGEGAASTSGKAADTTGAGTKKKAGATAGTNAAISAAKLDVKSWFQCYETSEDHLFDHIVFINDEECDDWSVTTGSTLSTADPNSKSRSESNLSVDVSSGVPTTGPLSPIGSPSKATGKIRSGSNLSQNSIDKLYPGIGVKQKPRSNSAVSAISTDDVQETESAAAVDSDAIPVAQMASLTA
jgi:hypothetical protein